MSQFWWRKKKKFNYFRNVHVNRIHSKRSQRIINSPQHIFEWKIANLKMFQLKNMFFVLSDEPKLILIDFQKWDFVYSMSSRTIWSIWSSFYIVFIVWLSTDANNVRNREIWVLFGGFRNVHEFSITQITIIKTYCPFGTLIHSTQFTPTNHRLAHKNQK